MWRSYLDVIARRAKKATNILDRFHIMAHMSKAIDEVRAGEAKAMRRDGYEPILKRRRWCLLKRPENLTEKQETKLSDLLQHNLRSIRAYLLKEDFQGFYVLPAWADKFLDRWCRRTIRFAARADEEGREDATQPPRSHLELVRSQGQRFGRRARGPQRLRRK